MKSVVLTFQPVSSSLPVVAESACNSPRPKEARIYPFVKRVSVNAFPLPATSAMICVDTINAAAKNGGNEIVMVYARRGEHYILPAIAPRQSKLLSKAKQSLLVVPNFI